MLPFLRIVPIGGVCLAVFVLVLALEPPGKPPQVVSPDMVLARGPLIDRAAHPEWPQMLVRSAYMRADEILKLRDLPNTPTLIAPIVLPPQRPTIVAKPAPVAATPPQVPADQATPPAPQPVTGTASLPANVDTGKPAPVIPSPPLATPAPAVTTPAAPAASATTTEANSKIDVKVEPAVPTPAAPAIVAPAPQTAAAPADAMDVVPVPEPKPTKLAALPVERATSGPAPDEVTSAVADSSSATIPVDIGEASSTELPIVLPRERPAILGIRHQAEPRRRAVHPRHGKAKAAVKPKPPSNQQPASQVNLFDQLFDNSNGAKKKVVGSKTRGATPAATQQSSATNTVSPPTYNQFDMR